MRVRSAADIGQVIREARQARGWSQTELADRIGASRVWVSSVENGKPSVELGLVLSALQALDVHLGVSSLGHPAPGYDPRVQPSPMPALPGPQLRRGGKPLVVRTGILRRSTGTTMKSNPHLGTSFDSFLDEAGIREDVHAEAQKRLAAEAEKAADEKPEPEEQADGENAGTEA